MNLMSLQLANAKPVRPCGERSNTRPVRFLPLPRGRLGGGSGGSALPPTSWSPSATPSLEARSATGETRRLAAAMPHRVALVECLPEPSPSPSLGREGNIELADGSRGPHDYQPLAGRTAASPVRFLPLPRGRLGGGSSAATLPPTSSSSRAPPCLGARSATGETRRLAAAMPHRIALVECLPEPSPSPSLGREGTGSPVTDGVPPWPSSRRLSFLPLPRGRLRGGSGAPGLTAKPPQSVDHAHQQTPSAHPLTLGSRA